MESDISLLEVAGEDDSLLQPIPEDDLLLLEKESGGITAANSGFFLCSPLVTDRSNCAISGSSSDVTDKENINANNLEGPKLSIVPQQMKMKKKARGYNLRKSLAWNKAFFTEEGVLDSAELSMITGSTGTSCGAALGVIDEEMPAMAVGGGYRDTPTSTPIVDRKNGRCLLPKRGSSTKDNVKLKELSAKDVNRSGSKRGSCPRPVASLSAKRLTTSNATKTVNKEERISRIPAPKRDPSVISRAPRNAATIRASDAKSNQVAQRAGNNLKITMSKGSSISAKGALNKEKDVNASKSLKAKAPILQPRRNLANPVLKVNSSRSQHDPTDSNGGLKAASNSLISKPLSLNDDSTRKVSASITQNIPPDVRYMQQTQMPKPSGLRMPSPSMGFFGQKKVPSFPSVQPATSEMHNLSKSNIPNVRMAGSSNPICQLATLVPRNVVKASHGEASGETNAVSCLNSGSSVEPVSHDRAKSASKVANIHIGKVNGIGVSTMNKVLSTHGLEKPDVQYLSRIHDEITDQLAECKSHHVSFNNFGDSTKSYLGEANDTGSQCMPRALDDLLNFAKDCNEPQSSEQVELTNSSDCMIERTFPDHQRLAIRTSNSLKRSRTSIEFEQGRFEENVGNDSNGQESCSFDLDEAFQTHKLRTLRRKSEASDIDHCVSNECNNIRQSTSALPNSDSMHLDDDKPTAPMPNSTLLQGNWCFLTSHHDDTSLETEVLTRESIEVWENKLESEINLSLLPHSTADACLMDSGPDEMVDMVSDMQQNDTSLEMEMNQVDHGGVEVTCDAGTAETLLISQDLHSSDTENQSYEAHECIGSKHVQNEDKQNSPVLSSGSGFNQLPGLAELQNSCVNMVDVSPESTQGKCSIEDLLHMRNSDKHGEETITDSVIDNSDVCTSECLSNYDQMASPKDNSCVHEKTHDTKTDDSILESEEIEPLLKSSKCSTAKSFEYDKILSGEGASETISKEARMTCNNFLFCSLPTDQILCRENVPQNMETNELENHKSSEMNGNILCQNENELNGEMDQLLDTEICRTYKDNGQSQARTSCNDSLFCSPARDLGSSVPNDYSFSSKNVQHYMEIKELENHKSPEMNGNIPCPNENELNSEMDHLPDTETCSTYNDNAPSEARSVCNDSSFCSPAKDLCLSIPGDPIMSRENVQQYRETKELVNHKSPEINVNILCKYGNELNSEMDRPLETEMYNTYKDNAPSEAKSVGNDSSFCSPTKVLDSSIANDQILPRENVQLYMETKELVNLNSPEMNVNILCNNGNEFDSEMDGPLDTETCSTYKGNAPSEARSIDNDSSFCSPTKELGSSIANDHILSRENVQHYMEKKKLVNHKSPEMNVNILCKNGNKLDNEMDRPLDIEACSTYKDNAPSEARSIGNVSSFCSLTNELGSSIPNDQILSRKNVQHFMETKEPLNHKSPEMNVSILCKNGNELNNEIDHPLDVEACSTYKDNASSEARSIDNDSSFCLPTKELGSSILDDHILSRENVQQLMETKELENHTLCKNGNELDGEMEHPLDAEVCSTYNNDAQSMQLGNSEDMANQNALGIKTSPNAVPFSEEWLAAIEAAGEGILTMKTGAVQNSPPDKSQPEPGPWSPVKRKNNQGIGPFDCTKCTNAS